MSLVFPESIKGIIDGNALHWNSACDYLHGYFVAGNNLSHTFFTMDGLGDDADDNRVTSVDIVAMLALDEASLGKARRAVMADADGRIAHLLSQIPGDVDLVDATPEMIGENSPLACLIDLLTHDYKVKEGGVAVVLARKRPRLVPLLTRAQLTVLGLEKTPLLEAIRLLAAALRENDGRLAYQLYYVNSSAEIWEGIPQVQLLSVLLYRDYQRVRQELKEAKEAAKAQKAALKAAQKAQQKARKKAAKEEKQALKAAQKKAKLAEKQKATPAADLFDNPDDLVVSISTDAFKL